jgi:hypothetical protein
MEHFDYPFLKKIHKILKVVAKAGNECTLEKNGQREPRKSGTEILSGFRNSL